MASCFSDSEKVNSFHHILFTCDLLTTLAHLTKLTMRLMYAIYLLTVLTQRKG